jgi:hypothetical protein
MAWASEFFNYLKIVKNQRNSGCHMGCPPMIESLHFHRGYSLRLHKSKPFINYGIISIVLECIPRRSVLEQIEAALRRIIAPIPAKPTPVQTVTTEPPRIVTPQEAR